MDSISFFWVGVMLGALSTGFLMLALAYPPRPSRRLNPLSDYEIRTVNNGAYDDGKYAKITPYYLGKPITEGTYPHIWGYGSAVRKAKRAIRVHRRNHVDPNRSAG